MAAWTARIDAISPTGDGLTIQVAVSYWAATDTTFTTELFAKAFAFSCNAVQADVVQTIKDTGAAARQAQTRPTALQPNIGSTIAIP